MKEYKILKSFRGSNTGATVTDYTANTTDFLSDELAEVALDEGWVVHLNTEKAPEIKPETEEKPKKTMKKNNKTGKQAD